MIFEKILREWISSTPSRGNIVGCCRVYVSVSIDKKNVKNLEEACKNYNIIFQKKSYYGDLNAIYVGYDNCDGISIGKAEKLVEIFKNNGISAFVCLNGD